MGRYRPECTQVNRVELARRCERRAAPITRPKGLNQAQWTRARAGLFLIGALPSVRELAWQLGIGYWSARHWHWRLHRARREFSYHPGETP